jgi:hypothetical protein
MPGPMSAPNGDARLVEMTGQQRTELLESKKLTTGKTLKKRIKKDGSPMCR